ANTANVGRALPADGVVVRPAVPRPASSGFPIGLFGPSRTLNRAETSRLRHLRNSCRTSRDHTFRRDDRQPILCERYLNNASLHIVNTATATIVPSLPTSAGTISV